MDQNPEGVSAFWSGVWRLQADFRIASHAIFSYRADVKVAARKREKSETQLLDQATTGLLKAAKQKMVKKHGRVDYGKLRKEGYSDRFLAKLEQA